MTEAQLMTVGQVAGRFGVHPETVRRWERAGIIEPAVRRRGQRVYDESAMVRIAASVLRRPLVMPQATKEDD
jgi:MerR family copper efflux transcriptional regulator